MGEGFFTLSREDQKELLQTGAERTGKRANLLEKDIWVIWTLDRLFAPGATHELTFKGGTSLSKAYQVIDRFSEDIDLTIDIRRLMDDPGLELHPKNNTQAKNLSDAVKKKIPIYIETSIRPALEAALTAENLGARINISPLKTDTVELAYASHFERVEYNPSKIILEFGAKSTGEPHSEMPVQCDVADHFNEVRFPSARPRVMDIARTFWEKVTAVHAYCRNGKLKGERFARHWFDLHAIYSSPHKARIGENAGIKDFVAEHKNIFFRERDSDGTWIDYRVAVHGNLHLVPDGKANEGLREDYRKMIENGMFAGTAPAYESLMESIGRMQADLNADSRGRLPPQWG
jgi:hypothetical protein